MVLASYKKINRFRCVFTIVIFVLDIAASENFTVVTGEKPVVAAKQRRKKKTVVLR